MIIRGILVDPLAKPKNAKDEENLALRVVKFDESNLYEMYNLLGCDYIEIPRRFIGKKIYSIICDEEGRFKENPVALWDSDMQEPIVGKVLIVSEGSDGQLASLTDMDLVRIATAAFRTTQMIGDEVEEVTVVKMNCCL